MTVYPKTLYAHVLLDEDNNIVDWKTSPRQKTLNNWISKTRLAEKGVKVESKKFIAKNDKDYREILANGIHAFYSTFKVNESFSGWKPY